MSSDDEQFQPDTSSVPTEVATPVSLDEVEVPINGLQVHPDMTDQLSEDIAEIDGTEQEIQPIQSEEHINPLTDEQQVQELSLMSNLETLPSLEVDEEGDEQKDEPVEPLDEHLEEQLQTIRDQLNAQVSTPKIPSSSSTTRVSTQPSTHVSKQPSTQTSTHVSTHVSKQPSTQASKQPSTHVSTHVSKQPSTQTSTHVSKQPSKQPSTQTSKQPSTHSSKQPSKQPSVQPSTQVSTQPSVQPSTQPSRQPSIQPSLQPSVQPSRQPSRKPSFAVMSELEHQLHHPIQEEVAIDVHDVTSSPSPTGPSIEPLVNGTTRNRKIDRRNLANDILAELPISIRFNENAFIDGNQDPTNYLQDWEQWNENLDDDGYDLLEVLLMTIAEDELKYKRSSNRNNYWNKGIQTALFVMGTAIVYIQASSTSAEVITRFNVASGIGTSIATMLLGLGNFAKKGPHFNKTSSNLMRLRCWIENKLILPLDRRYSPYDIYTIAKIAHEAILLEAKQGLNESK